jgi:hypothetical protein
MDNILPKIVVPLRPVPKIKMGFMTFFSSGVLAAAFRNEKTRGFIHLPRVVKGRPSKKV